MPPGVGSVIVPVVPSQMVDGPEMGPTWAKDAKENNRTKNVRLRCFIFFLNFEFIVKKYNIKFNVLSADFRNVRATIWRNNGEKS